MVAGGGVRKGGEAREDVSKIGGTGREARKHREAGGGVRKGSEAGGGARKL